MKTASGLLSGFLGGLVTLIGFWTAAAFVGKGGGICGPSIGLILAFCMFLASFPASAAVAIFAYHSSRKYYSEKGTAQERKH